MPIATVDVIGVNFGHLTVIAVDRHICKCRCHCGDEMDIFYYKLLNGQRTSCGCKGNKISIGDRFGMWTTLMKITDTANRKYKWLCRCDCGKEKLVQPATLINRDSTSCGCKNKKNETLEDFMQKVYAEPNTGCWLWAGNVDRDGYGVYLSKKANTNRAHRVSYYLHYGSINANLSILHSCDNPSCVNPQHLRMGTSLENTQDMIRKKRNVTGEKHHASKLTEGNVRAIRDEYRAGGVTQKQLAAKYNVSSRPIYDILRGKCWKNVK